MAIWQADFECSFHPAVCQRTIGSLWLSFAFEQVVDAGMEHYGPAPAPLNEKRDMYREAIEELLNAIYYLTRQVVRLEDLRGKLRRMGRRKVWSFASD